MKRALTDAHLEHSPKAAVALKKLRAESAVSSSPTRPSAASVHRLQDIAFGKLVKRYKRFLADVVLDASGETITAHCPNTGPLLGLLEDPSPAVLLSKSADPKRKCPYTLEAIKHHKGDASWIGIHSALANKMVHQMLKAKMIPQFVEFDQIRPEAVYGKDKKSRADFLLTCSDTKRKMFVEVKAITYSEKRGDISVGLFPDTKSDRAQKHVQELMDVMGEKTEVACVFVVLGNVCTAAGPFKETDAKFAELLKEAHEKGLIVIGVGIELQPEDEGNGCDFAFKQFLDIKLDP